MEESFSNWLLQQAPAIVLMGLLTIYLLKRNATLAKCLVDAAVKNSDERSERERKHADELSKVRSDAMLQQHSLLMTTLHSLEVGLTARLESQDNSSQKPSDG